MARSDRTTSPEFFFPYKLLFVFAQMHVCANLGWMYIACLSPISSLMYRSEISAILIGKKTLSAFFVITQLRTLSGKLSFSLSAIIKLIKISKKSFTVQPY